MIRMKFRVDNKIVEVKGHTQSGCWKSVESAYPNWRDITALSVQDLNDCTDTVIKTELFSEVYNEAKKISSSAEVIRCFYYRTYNGILGFRKFSKVHFACDISLGMTKSGYLSIRDNEITINGTKAEKEELKKLCDKILGSKRFSKSCLLGLRKLDDIFITSVDSIRRNKGIVIV